MDRTAQRRGWIRDPAAKKSKASFPELFFDLVFVFGLIQLSHTLATDFSSATVAEAALLVLAIWWIWINTAWVTNLLDTDREPVRFGLFALMLAGILMAIALPEAYGAHALAFAAIYAAMQICRSAFTAYAFFSQDRQSAMTFVRISVWSMVAGALWIAGALVEVEWRVSLWAAAIAVEYGVPLLRYPVPGFGRAPSATLAISGEHMAERCALFVIICLGEAILSSGRNAVEHMSADMTFSVFCSAFLGTGCMWWIYFHYGQGEAAEKAQATSKPEAVAHNLFTYGHLPIVAGIILTAVGEEFALSHASEDASFEHASAILGGPALFLAGNVWVKLAAASRLPISHLAGLVLLAATAAAVPFATNALIAIGATASLMLAALWEYVALRRSSPVAA